MNHFAPHRNLSIVTFKMTRCGVVKRRIQQKVRWESRDSADETFFLPETSTAFALEFLPHGGLRGYNSLCRFRRERMDRLFCDEECQV